jgi:TfoX/Sxy family transcriptional regulator of competence genes
MAWVKVPKENHPIFLAALPKDRRVSTIAMFGGIAGIVNGNMMSGLWARSVMVRVDAASQHEALQLDGAEPFDPMGRGTPMRDMVLLPEAILDEPSELRGWLQRALDHTATLPAKKKKLAAKAKAAKPAAKKPAKPAAKKPGKPATKRRAR